MANVDDILKILDVLRDSLTGEINAQELINKLLFGDNTQYITNFHDTFKTNYFEPTSSRFKDLYTKVISKIDLVNKELDKFDAKAFSDPFGFSTHKEEIDEKVNQIKQKLDRNLDNIEVNTDTKNQKNTSTEPKKETPSFLNAIRNSVVGSVFPEPLKNTKPKEEEDIEQKQFGKKETIIEFSNRTKDFLKDLLGNDFTNNLVKKMPKATNVAPQNVNQTSGLGSRILEDLGLISLISRLGLMVDAALVAGPAIAGIYALLSGPFNDTFKNWTASTLGKDSLFYKFLDRTGKNADGSKFTSEQQENRVLATRYGFTAVANTLQSRGLQKTFDAGKIAEEALPEASLTNRVISKIPVVRRLYSRATGQDIRPQTIDKAREVQNANAQKALAETTQKSNERSRILKNLMEAGSTEKDALKYIDEVERTAQLAAKGAEEATTLSKAISLAAKPMEYLMKVPGLSAILKNGLGKWVFKKIPFIGALLGLGLGAKQIQDGDTAGGVMTIISGLAAIVPGWGTVASIIIDGINWFLHHEGVIGTQEEMNAHKQALDSAKLKNADIFRAAGISEDMIKKYLQNGEVPNDIKTSTFDTPEKKEAIQKAKNLRDAENAKKGWMEGGDDIPMGLMDAYVPAKGTSRKINISGRNFQLNAQDDLIAAPFGKVFDELTNEVRNMRKAFMESIRNNNNQASIANISPVTVNNNNGGGEIQYTDHNLRIRKDRYRMKERFA